MARSDKSRIRESELLGRLNAEIGARWPHSDSIFQIERIRPAKMAGRSYVLDTLSISGSTLARADECQVLAGEVIDSLADKFECDWDEDSE